MDQDTFLLLRSAVDRSKRLSTVRLSIDFARHPGGETTPLQAIGNDGRGQGLRLKLYLAMVMLATKAPHVLRPYPASAYAAMLDIPDPGGQGARRVNQAQRWLHDNGFIVRVENGSHPPVMEIATIAAVGRWGGRYITLDIELWRNGWIHKLSGRAITMYVVLRELTGGRAAGATAAGDRKREYGLSDETWARGCAELQAAGLAKVTGIIDKADAFSRSQPRNRYVLLPDALKTPPTEYKGLVDD